MGQEEAKEKLGEILKTLGLNKNEILIYLDLMQHNNSSALDIAKSTGIHRSNTYDSLRKLIERGFAAEIKEGDKTLFQAINPEKIKYYIKQKEQEFDTLIPEIKDFGRKDDSVGSFSVAQGAFAAREALYDLLKLNSTIYAYGASKEAVETFGEGFLKDFHKERIKKKIMMKHIYNKDAFQRIKYLNKIKYTEARYLPEKYHTVAATAICRSSVVIFIFAKPVHVIKINNQIVADAYKDYFELLYRIGKTD